MNMSRAQKRRFINNDEKKEKYNTVISNAIAEVIRFSSDDQFRSQCFQLMKVNNTNDFQLALKDKLISLTSSESNKAGMRKRSIVHNKNIETERNLELDHDLPGPSGVGMTAMHLNTGELDGIDRTNNLHINAANIMPVSKTRKTFISDEKPDFSNSPNNRTIKNCNKAEDQTIQPTTNDSMKADSINEMNNVEKDFWPTEQCCLWRPDLIQDQVNNFDLNDNDTNWK